MMTGFVDRRAELAELQGAWNRPGAQFVVVWGRRRVGKTTLLKEAFRGRRHVYLLADTQSEEAQLRRFARACSETIGPPGLSFRDWEGLFEYLGSEASRRRFAVVIDEVGFLHEANRAFFSIVQRHWDETLSRRKLVLVLCGSAVSAMEREILGYRSPLYGRRTGQVEVLPLGYRDARLFFPRSTEERRVELYALGGGIPQYLQQLEPDRDGVENVVRSLFPPGRFLHAEPRSLLLQEVREPSAYFSILTAIAGGAVRLNEISHRTGLAVTKLPKYIGVLRSLRLVRRIEPVTEPRKERMRRGHYLVADQLFRTWFRFVAPWSDLLEAREYGRPARALEEQWPAHVGNAFEEVCRELVRLRATGFGGPFEAVGTWWKGDQEIDVVALDRRRGVILAGECKWTSQRVGKDDLERLRVKTDALGGGWRRVRLALFSKSGFTQDCAAAAGPDVTLVDLRSLRSMISTPST